MKKMLFFLALATVIGCSKEAESDSGYFIFGYAHGFCVGNCVTVFKLEDDSLVADDDAAYASLTSPSIPFQSTNLPSDKVALAKGLQAQIPAALYNEPDGSVGCPDCRDQGLFYLKIKTGDTVREWRIDRDKPEYAAFCDSIWDTVQQLK
ncbi:MAG: hypothetical protein ABMA02_06765 [Saprospiraceae bacterium]